MSYQQLLQKVTNNRAWISGLYRTNADLSLKLGQLFLDADAGREHIAELERHNAIPDSIMFNESSTLAVIERSRYKNLIDYDQSGGLQLCHMNAQLRQLVDEMQEHVDSMNGYKETLESDSD